MKKLYSIAAAAALSAITIQASAFDGTPVVQRQCSMQSVTAPANRLKNMAGDNAARKAARADAASGQWTQWAETGTATFSIDNGFNDFGLGINYTGNFAGVQVSTRNDTGDANIIQYRLKGIYNNVDIILDYDKNTGALHMPQQPTGFIYNDKPLEVMDAATGFRTFMPGEDGEFIASMYDEYNYFVSPTGRFYVYLVYTYEGLYDFCAITDVEIQLDGYPDYTPELTFNNRITPDRRFGIVETPETCENVRISVVPGGLTQSKIDAVLNGTEASFQIKGGRQNVMVPELEPNKGHTLIAISYADGIACEMAYKYLAYADDEAGKWTSAGSAEIYTDFLEGLFNRTPSAFNAYVERNNDNPYLYRLVNAYGIDNPFVNTADLDGCTVNEYLFFDTSDPDYVLIQPSILGIDVGSGAIYIDSYYNYLVDNGKSETSAKGTATGGIIDRATGRVNFDNKSFVVCSDNWAAIGRQANAAYSAGPMYFTIPDYAAVNDIIADIADRPGTRYYNMQGIEVNATDLAPGMYIRNNGKKADKVLIR